MRERKAVYEATFAIPELGVEVGDRIVVRWGHPTAPLAVVKRYGYQTLQEHREQFGSLPLLHTEGPPARRLHLEVVPLKAVYEATYAIPELGVERGDVILVEPSHPKSPMLVVRRFDRNRLPFILDHLDGLTWVSGAVDRDALRPSAVAPHLTLV